MDNERKIISQEEQADSTPTFEIKERNTTYVIGTHFSEGTKDTIDKKIKRLIRDEIYSSADRSVFIYSMCI